MHDRGTELGIHNHLGTSIIPRESSSSVTGIELRKMRPDGDNDHRDYDEVAIKFSSPLSPYWVCENNRHGWGDPIHYIQNFDPVAATDITAKFDEFTRLKQEYHEARHKYEQDIYSLLDKCTTLKQLLEVWPGAESLVPSHKLAQMHTKVTRKQKAAAIKEEINFDPTVANQAVLTAKLLGG